MSNRPEATEIIVAQLWFSPKFDHKLVLSTTTQSYICITLNLILKATHEVAAILILF